MHASLLLQAVAVAPLARLRHETVHRLLVYVVGERLVALVFELFFEGSLQVPSEMLGHGLFGKHLHLVIDGCIDAQAVLVEVVGAAVGLVVLVQPSVNGVGGPAERVGGVFFLELIVGAAGLLGVHVAPEHVAEVRGVTGVVVHHMIVENDGKLLQRVPLLLVDESGLGHASYDEVAAVQRVVGIEDRVEARRLVHHAHKHGALFYAEVSRGFGEEGLGSRFDTVGAAAEEDGIQVHGHYFILGVVTLQAHGGYPFLEFGEHYVQFPGLFLAGIERLGELLCYGTTSSLAGVAQEESLYCHAGQALHVDSGMLVEAYVLGSDRGMYQIGGQLVV